MGLMLLAPAARGDTKTYEEFITEYVQAMNDLMNLCKDTGSTYFIVEERELSRATTLGEMFGNGPDGTKISEASDRHLKCVLSAFDFTRKAGDVVYNDGDCPALLQTYSIFEGEFMKRLTGIGLQGGDTADLWAARWTEAYAWFRTTSPQLKASAC